MIPSLNKRLSRNGFRIASAEPEAATLDPLLPDYDIEDTLLDSARQISQKKDYRLAGLLFTWILVHGERVIIEKLKKSTLSLEHLDLDAVAWITAAAALARHKGYEKWKLLAVKWKSLHALLPSDISRAAIDRHGADPILKTHNLLLPKTFARIRERDVFTPQELVEHNRQYRNRFIYGPNWRADIVTAVEEGAKNPSDAMYRAGCSYEPAYRIFHELEMAGFNR